MRPVALLLLLLVAALLSACAGGESTAGGEATASPAGEAASAQESEAEPGGTFADIPEIVRRVRPSVVTVFVPGVGQGSGVVYDDQGHIVTNAHVVADARQVEVELASGERISAAVVAADAFTDVAVLDAERPDLPPAEFADGLPEVGELAIAIGNPLGFENSVTAGIVSGVGREIPSQGRTPALVDLIQTDAPISPGNSGGALVGDDGTVIGINVAYLPPQRTGAVSVGFAIPAPTVTDVADQLIADGRAEHAYLGITPLQVTPELAQAFGLQVDSGVLVESVAEGDPAAAAGVQRGDVIVGLGGETIRTVEDLFAALRGHEPGETVSLTVVRGGERRQLEVELGQRPS